MERARGRGGAAEYGRSGSPRQPVIWDFQQALYRRQAGEKVTPLLLLRSVANEEFS